MNSSVKSTKMTGNVKDIDVNKFKTKNKKVTNKATIVFIHINEHEVQEIV